MNTLVNIPPPEGGKGPFPPVIWAKHFVAFVVRQCLYEFNRVFWKSCIVFCAKPKEVDPIKLISLRQTSVSIALKYIIYNGVLK